MEEVDKAVQSAKAAFASWRAVSLAKRAELMFAIRELVHARKEDIAKILVAEHGKVLSDAMGEVTRGLEVIEFACGIPTLLKGEFSEQASTGVDVYSIRQPVGVVAGITPFNFPAMVPMWMWAPAIACGNTFVLKPSEKDPSASIFTAELLKEAGLPDGVFNVVHGDKVAVDALLEHPDVAALSFVGSTPIARYIYETGTKHGKRVQALGGAKNHMIVLPDADIEMAADAAVSAAYGSAGERCMAVSVVVAVGDAADPLVAAIQERLPKITVGDGMDPASEMGPLVTREHRDKVAGYLDSGAAQGATVVADGRESAPEGDGFFLGVSLLDDVTTEMDAYRDEIFGPVLGVMRVGTYDEALKLINDNPYGNGTAIFTRDGGVARQFQFDVEVGMVGINVPIPVPVAYYSFGGWKAVAVRRQPHLRAGGHPLLHARQGRHEPLARPGHEQGRPRLPADAVGIGAAGAARGAGLVDARYSRRMSIRYEIVRLLLRLGVALGLALALAALVAVLHGGGYRRSLELCCYFVGALMLVLAAAGNSPGRGYGLDVESRLAGSSRRSRRRAPARTGAACLGCRVCRGRGRGPRRSRRRCARAEPSPPRSGRVPPRLVRGKLEDVGAHAISSCLLGARRGRSASAMTAASASATQAKASGCPSASSSPNAASWVDMPRFASSETASGLVSAGRRATSASASRSCGA